MPTDYEKTEQGDDPSCPRTERAIIEMTFGEYKKREDELLALRARVAQLGAALDKANKTIEWLEGVIKL